MPSRGGQPYRTTDKAGEQIFQFTTSRGGRLLLIRSPLSITSPFNSRPLGEVDSDGHYVLLFYVLSIHDLSGRSTLENSMEKIRKKAFQFTTSRGGRRVTAPYTEAELAFNSRPLGEVDLFFCKFLKFQTSFNSRPLGEVDTITPRVNEAIGQLSIHDLSGRSTLSFVPLH